MDSPEKGAHPSLSGSRRLTWLSSGSMRSMKAYQQATLSETSSQIGKIETMNPYTEQSIAESYDSHYSEKIYKVENALMSHTLERYCDNARVLDLGAGTGLTAELTVPESYVAVDMSEAMLKVLTTKFAGDKTITPFTIVGNLCSIQGLNHVYNQLEPLAPFDIVTCLWAGHDIHSRLLLRMIYDLLTPYGTVFMHGNFPRRKNRSASPAQQDETSDHFLPDKLYSDLVAENFEEVQIKGCNAIPDFLSRNLSEPTLFHAMRKSQKLPAKYHYHGVAIGRKPYDRYI